MSAQEFIHSHSLPVEDHSTTLTLSIIINKMAGTLENNVTNTFNRIMTSWQQRLKLRAYHHRSAEWCMYFLAISGILLWGVLPVDWVIVRWSLIVHIVVSLLVFPFTLGLFWFSHRKLLARSKKRFLRLTGTAIDWSLFICTLSGIYLFFIGDNGNMNGYIIATAHLIVGLLLAPLVLVHAFRFSVLKIFSSGNHKHTKKS